MARGLGALAVTLLACGNSASGAGSPPPIDAGAYDQSCKAASDCLLVAQGDVCAPCVSGPFDSCNASAAISASDMARYQADYDRLKAQCPSRPPQSCPNICAIAYATCTAGTCAVCRSVGCADAGAQDAGPPDSGMRDGSGD